tara:strand:+ start:1052 stop:1363 length:312 start_codon:yes stop_codon:yes gene_type:complete
MQAELNMQIQAAIMALPEHTPQAVVDGIAEQITKAYHSNTDLTTLDSVSDTPANYITKSGDTLSQIAKDYNTSVEKIAEHNKIKNVNEIKEGQVLDMSFAIAL